MWVRLSGGPAPSSHQCHLQSYVAELRESGVEFRNELVENQGRKQIICVDPSGNVIELFEDAPE